LVIGDHGGIMIWQYLAESNTMNNYYVLQ